MDLSPMLASWSPDVPQGPDWAFEPKWDGLRALLEVEADLSVRVTSRQGRGWASTFPELAGAGPAVGRPAVLDGEVVALDGSGRPSFSLLSDRLREAQPDWAARRAPVTFVAFDVLRLEGRSLTDQPWWLRRELLTGLGLRGPRVVTTLACDDGDALLSATRSMGIEGVVGKRRAGRYVCGRRTSAWVKVKHPGTGWFDVTGWRPPTRAYPQGGVLVADEGRPAGTVVPGFGDEAAAALRHFVDRHGVPHGPAVRLPHGAQVRVRYGERTPRGLLRHATAHDLRPALPDTP